ncbi:hypothetical protein ACHQM5_002726 [Ranunculus cassubicifolius]
MNYSFLIHLLLLLNLFFFFQVSNAATEPVRDTNGKKVISGVNYYILPVARGRGGGLALDVHTGKCPLDVVQEEYELSSGYPVTFKPTSIKKGIIRVSTDLNFKFGAVTRCGDKTVWRLKNYDEVTKQWFVTSAGVEGNPGQKTVGNWFKIEKFGADYKLVFCPMVCKFCKVICRDIGIYIGADGVRRLALSDEPFRVMFKKQ